MTPGRVLGRGAAGQPPGQTGGQRELTCGHGDEAPAQSIEPETRSARLADPPVCVFQAPEATTQRLEDFGGTLAELANRYWLLGAGGKRMRGLTGKRHSTAGRGSAWALVWRHVRALSLVGSACVDEPDGHMRVRVFDMGCYAAKATGPGSPSKMWKEWMK